jgi:hypothetical protein
MPDLVANREIMTTHQINIDVEPAADCLVEARA